MPSKCEEEEREERERVFVLGQQRAAAAGLVGVLLMLCKVLWQNASARPRNPSRKLLQTWLPACRVPLRYPWQRDWVWLCVCFSCFLFHFCSPYFILTFFLWALWKVAVVRLIGNVHLWHFVGTEQRPELFRIQTLCLISRYTYHLSFSFPTLNVFPQFPHKIAKCSLCPATIPQSLCLPPFCSLPFSQCPSDSQLSALSGHRYSFRWLLTVVAVVVGVGVANHNELENYARYFLALSKRKLCNQFVQLGCLEYVSKGAAIESTPWGKWLRAHFVGIAGAVAGECRVQSAECWEHKSFNRIVWKLINRLSAAINNNKK